jgi:hypothetical protein
MSTVVHRHRFAIICYPRAVLRQSYRFVIAFHIPNGLIYYRPSFFTHTRYIFFGPYSRRHHTRYSPNSSYTIGIEPDARSLS